MPSFNLKSILLLTILLVFTPICTLAFPAGNAVSGLQEAVANLSPIDIATRNPTATVMALDLIASPDLTARQPSFDHDLAARQAGPMQCWDIGLGMCHLRTIQTNDGQWPYGSGAVEFTVFDSWCNVIGSASSRTSCKIPRYFPFPPSFPMEN